MTTNPGTNKAAPLPPGDPTAFGVPSTGPDTTAPTAVCNDGTAYIDGTGSPSLSAADIGVGSTDDCAIAGFALDQVLGCNTTLDCYLVDATGIFNPISISGTSVNLGDDENSPALPIGFDFEFFGTTYTSFHIASNGLLGFNLTHPAPNIAATGCCLGQALPNATAPNDLIAFAWEDLSPNLGGTIEYTTTGTAPNRILVMNFTSIAFFNGAGSVTTQVQLHESSNRIEIHTTNITTGGVNQGLTVGIENADGTKAFTQSGFNRTTSNGTLKTNDYVAFVPAAEVVLTVTDTAGNSSNCTASIVVLDTLSPTATCQNITVSLDSTNTAVIAASDVDGGSTDNCGIASLSIDTDSLNCSNIGTINVTLTATDSTGNTSNCTALVTVQDTIPPTLTCQNITVNLPSGGTTTLASSDIITASSDNCSIDSIVFDSVITCANAGTQNDTLTVFDPAGNSTSCIYTRSVFDSEAPIAVCQDITLNTGGSGSATLSVADLDGGSSDNCGIDTSFLDINTVDCNTAYDAYAVITNGTFNPIAGSGTAVSLNDDENSVNLPIGFAFTFFDSVYTEFNIASNGLMGFGFPVPGANLQQTGCCLGQFLPDTDILNNLIAFAWEDLSPNLGGTIEYFTSGTAPNRILAMNFTGIDFFNGAGNVTVQVQLHETTNRIEIHTTDITTGGVNQGLTVGIENINGTQAYTQPGFNRTTSNGTIKTNDFVGFYPAKEVLLSISDASGAVDSCTAAVAFITEDTVAPSAVCQNITVTLDSSNQATITTTDLDNGTTDNCTLDSLSLSFSGNSGSTISFNCSDIGPQIVTLNGTDINGNSDSCTGVVTVLDSVPPIAICQPATYHLDASGQATINASDLDGGSNDVCAFSGVSVSNSSLSCADVGTVTRQLTATDLSGNTDSCSATLTVLDTISPTAQCQNLFVLLDTNGTATPAAALADGGSSDACGVDSLSLASGSYDCQDIGSTVTDTLIVFDPSGNTSICTFFVTVLETRDPVAICQNVTVYLDGGGNASVGVSDIDNGSSDNCSISSQSLSATSFTCTNLGNNVVTMTVTDPSGNSASCFSQVTVEDSIAPSATCQDVTIFLDGNGAASLSASDITLSSSDNCAATSSSIDTSSFSCSQAGINTVTLSVFDAGGNTGTCTAQVTVNDTIAPVAVCQNTTVYLDNNGTASFSTSDIDGGSSDACNLASSTLSSPAGSGTTITVNCSDIGILPATLTVGDISLNTSFCSADVTIMDTISPSISCQDITLYLDNNGSGSIDSADVTTGAATDNCSGLGAITLSQSSFATVDTGLNVITVSVSDSSGNTGTCTSNVTVVDSFFVGIEEELIAFGFSLTASPNPTNGLLKVHVICADCSPLEETEMILTSLDGKILLRESVSIHAGEGHQTIDLTRFAQGNYLLSVKQQGATLTRRIVRY